jgi:hypothetical protein
MLFQMDSANAFFVRRVVHLGRGETEGRETGGRETGGRETGGRRKEDRERREEYTATQVPSRGSLRGFGLQKELKRGGSYFIDGFLNTKYQRGTKWRQLHFHGQGRHSVAVKGGRVLDSAFAPGETMGLGVLHLRKGQGVPDPKRGLLKHINLCYRVFSCSGKCHMGGRCEPDE